MISKRLLTTVSLVGLLAGFATMSANAQTVAALSGKVSSTEEGLMEGVLVSAKKEGSTVTTTVVSNAKGEFSFPADRMGPGHYNITIRAAGCNLAGPKQVDVATGAPATAEIKLVKAKNTQAQLSNGEWNHERAGRRARQVVPAGLRGLPYAAARLLRHAYSRRVEERVRPHGALCAGNRAGASAASPPRRRSQRAPARSRQHDGCSGRVFGQRQRQQS